MSEKFLGIGLTNAMAIAIFTMLFIVAMKSIFTMYEVPGVSTVVRAV